MRVANPQLSPASADNPGLSTTGTNVVAKGKLTKKRAREMQAYAQAAEVFEQMPESDDRTVRVLFVCCDRAMWLTQQLAEVQPVSASSAATQLRQLSAALSSALGVVASETLRVHPVAVATELRRANRDANKALKGWEEYLAKLPEELAQTSELIKQLAKK